MSSKDYIYCYQGSALRVAGGTAVIGKNYDKYNPLGLPPFTIRCKFKSGYTPTMGDSQTLVDSTENVWDIYKNSTNWSTLFYEWTRGIPLLMVLGANTTGVTEMYRTFTLCDSLTSIPLFDTSECTNMSNMFFRCESLQSVPLFDTSSCTNMEGMFGNCLSLPSVPLFDTSACTNMQGIFNGCYSLPSVPLFDTSACTNMSYMFLSCRSLTSVPLFNTSSCTNMNYMFSGCTSLTSVPLFDTSSCTDMVEMFWSCYNVQSGALALYQQASTQATPPSSHTNCFYRCGRDTVTGAAELAQIPQDWGGTMSAQSHVVT